MGQCLPSLTRLFGAARSSRRGGRDASGTMAEEMMAMVGIPARADPESRFVLSAARRHEFEQLQLTLDAKSIEVQRKHDKAAALVAETGHAIHAARTKGHRVSPALQLRFDQRLKRLDAVAKAALMYENALGNVATVLSTTEQIQSVADVNRALRHLTSEFDMQGAAKLIEENQTQIAEIGRVNDELMTVVTMPAQPGGTYSLADNAGGEVEFTEEEEAELRAFEPTHGPAPLALPAPAPVSASATPAPSLLALPAPPIVLRETDRHALRSLVGGRAPSGNTNPLFTRRPDAAS